MKERLSLILRPIKKLSFYKKKTFYIVLTVLFSLILLADITVAVFVPANRGFGAIRGGFQNRSGFQSDELVDDGEMPQMPEGMGRGERSQMPEGMENGEIPQMPEGMEIGEMPQMPGGMFQTNTGFLQTWKSHWLVIFITFFLLDGFSIFMWIFLTKKEKKLKQLEVEAKLVSDGEVHLVRKPKKEKQHQHVGLIVLAALLILAIVVKVLSSQSGNEIPQTEATVHSGTVASSSVSSILPGTGTLQEEEAEVLELVSDVEITQWYVSNGDTVAAGDKLAQVDTISAMSAIVAVQEKLAALDEELEEHEDEEIEDTVVAGSDGRVKMIYAAEDTGVVDTMYESGALLLISLDGLMAVSFETGESLSAGDTVTVRLSDGEEISGKVESMISKTAVVTVSDEESDFGDAVTVVTEDGTEVGSGELYIHSELKVTGFTGTVLEVEVSVDEEVSAGETLLTLTDTDYTGEYEMLLTKRSELESYMQELFQMYRDQYIYAKCDGVISGLEETAVSEEDETDSEVSEDTEVQNDVDHAEASAMSYNKTTKLMNSSSRGIATMSYTTVKTGGLVHMSTSSVKTVILSAEDTSGTGAEVIPDTGTEGTSGTGTTENPNAGTTENQGTGTTKKPDAGTTENQGTTHPGGTAPGSGNIQEPEVPGNNESFTNYIGTVATVTNDGSTVHIDLAANDGRTNSLSIPASLYVYNFASGKYMSATAADIQVNDTLMLIYESDSSVFCIRISGATGSNTEMPGGNGSGQITGNQQMPSAGMGSSGDSYPTISEETADIILEEIEKDYGVTTTSWLSIIPQHTMEVTITVDEMDILALEEGQEALVTLDAFPGQSFEGIVKSVHVNGTNSGGSSKFEAVIHMERQENMLAGMNASVKITLDTKNNILVIPVAALVEQESGVFVYTSYDEKTEALGDMVEVTTGVSDGENVEILSGLEKGNEYYYSYLDVVNYNAYFASESGGFSMGSMFGGRGGR